VICTGNPWVFSNILGPVPATDPYPLKGSGWSYGFTQQVPGVYPNPYPLWVTCRFVITNAKKNVFKAELPWENITPLQAHNGIPPIC
jgi:hypothetical protein